MARKNALATENTRLIFKNFSGKPSAYNAEGDRNFGVIVPMELVADLSKDGWNVKELLPREEGGAVEFYIKVRLNYRSDGNPPKIVLVSDGVKTLLDESSVGELDYADIKSTDIVINPYHWERPGSSGTSGYLSALYVTVEPEPFASKYADMPYSGAPTDNVTDSNDDYLPFN